MRHTLPLLILLAVLIGSVCSCHDPAGHTEAESDSEIVLDDGTVLFKYSNMDCYAIKDLQNCTSEVYIVPEGKINGFEIREIWEKAVVGNQTIKTMIIPDNVTSFSFDLYYEFSSLESIFICPGVRHIYAGSFAMCPNLKQVTVDIRHPDYYSENNAVIEKRTHRIIAASSTTRVIPDSVRIIGANAFDCMPIETVRIPDGVLKIEEYAFQFCDGLIACYIPASVGTIERNAFYLRKGFTIFCEAEAKPSGWSDEWYNIFSKGPDDEHDDTYYKELNDRFVTVRWGATREEYDDFIRSLTP